MNNILFVGYKCLGLFLLLNNNLLLCFPSISNSLDIDVFPQQNHRGTKYPLVVSGCLPTLDHRIDESIVSINTHNNCVQLYEEQNCTGDYLIIRPGSPSHNDLGFYRFSEKTRSISECFEKCHHSYKETHEKPVSLQLYGEGDFTSDYNRKILVNPEECHDITEIMESQSWNKFRMEVDTKVCVEVHEFSDCTGESLYLTMGRKNVLSKNVVYWPNKNKTRAISLCGYSCAADSDISSPSKATLFPMENFYGPRKTFNISNCTELPEKWKSNNTKSIMSLCVSLYEDTSCENLLEHVTDTPGLTYENVKSMKMCDIKEINASGSSWWIFIVLICISACCGIVFVIYKRYYGVNQNRIDEVEFSNAQPSTPNYSYNNLFPNVNNSSRASNNRKSEMPLINVDD